MKTPMYQQEILLMTNTSFSKRLCILKGHPEEHAPYVVAEQMEEACWDGSLHHLLPGIIENSCNSKKLFLWQMKHKDACLELELGEYPREIHPYYSIEIHHILSLSIYN